ncbi:hypothetical protein ACIA2T_29130 [Amycolatopsis japonica]|uniref:hypothetical protein n=1 Tax=Amycolatopsis japonica TaxID=208439 RepID=UPI003793E175
MREGAFLAQFSEDAAAVVVGAGDPVESAPVSMRPFGLFGEVVGPRAFFDARVAGADPGAPIEPLNRAKEERDANGEDPASAPAEKSIGRAELEAMVDAFGELGRQVGNVSLGRLQELYGEIGLEMVYNAKEWAVDVTIRPPRRVDACVGEELLTRHSVVFRRLRPR